VPAADVTVVVITHRGRELLPACLDSLAAQTVPHQLLVIDNASADGSAELLTRRLAPGQLVRLERNTGFAGGVAQALDRVRTRFLALLNDDAVAAPDWLESLLARANADDGAGKRTAAWTSLLVRADRSLLIQNAGAGLLRSGYGADLLADLPIAAAGDQAADDEDTTVFGFCGGAALLRTDAVRAVGGFPAEFFLYYEDLDTSWRLHSAGWQIRRVNRATVRHAHSATADPRSTLFHRYNERNRLWTLVRNAPASIAVGAVLRFLATTVSLQLGRLTRRSIPDAPNFRTGLRLGVLGETVRALPRLLAERRRLGHRSQLRRSTVWNRWAGADR